MSSIQKYLFSVIVIVLLLISPSVHAGKPAVVSANPLATKVGMDILDKGGSAADAAVAMAFALSVVEPYNSGIGGGGFFLYYDKETNRTSFLDYREVAPLKISSLDYKKDPQSIEKGIKSVAVPGFLLGMETIHNRWRKVSWPSVIEPAIDLAKKGLPLRGLLKEKIESRKDDSSIDPEFYEVYLKPLENHASKIDQSDLAETLEDIKTGGAQSFYKGYLGQRLVDFMKKQGGHIGAQDLMGYHVYYRKPYKLEYDGYDIVSAPLPSSGGTGLGILFRRAIVHQLDRITPFSPRGYDLLIQGLTKYFEYREIALGDSPNNIVSHTTHLSVIDSQGNMAAMTNTLNYPFGSGVVLPDSGIVLNNEMDDFSLRKNTANRVVAGRRPLSSMSPTFIWKGDRPYMILGTPGGTTIPQNLFQILFYHWKWRMPLTKAIKEPKIYYSPKTKQVVVEEDMDKKKLEYLQAHYDVQVRHSIGNVQLIHLRGERMTPYVYSDPRGEGMGLVGREYRPPAPVKKKKAK